MRSVALLLIVLVFAQRSTADTLAPQSIDSLFAHADFVGIVRIDAGYFVSGKGAVYRATILRVLKGDSVANLFFGPFVGQAIGSEYLVFLANSKENVLEHWSKESHRDGPQPEYLSRSIIKYSVPRDTIAHKPPSDQELPALFPTSATYNAIMFEGLGILPLGYRTTHTYLSIHERMVSVIKVDTSHIILPKSIQTFPVDDSKKILSIDNLWGMKWVRKDDLVNYLRQSTNR
jgi:hypothetical protein